MMLARRFSILCLICMTFGIGFAALVQQTSRPANSFDIGMSVPCVFEDGLVCAIPKTH